MANQFLALSMFVMLLSFFIILNAMSNFEVMKLHEVRNSLSVAFSNQDLPQDLSANVKEDPAQAYRDGDTLDKLKGLFEAQITGVEAKKNRLGTTMHLRLPLDRFDKQLSSAGGGFGGALAPTLASLLSAEDDIPYSMDMLINLADNPATLQNDAPETVQQNIRRVSGYAQMIEQAGLPKKYLSAGLGEGPAGTIDLYFKRYQPFNPLGDNVE